MKKSAKPAKPAKRRTSPAATAVQFLAAEKMQFAQQRPELYVGTPPLVNSLKAPTGRMEDLIARADNLGQRLDLLLGRLGAINVQLFGQVGPKGGQSNNPAAPSGQFELLETKLAGISTLISSIDDEISRLAQV